MTKNVKKCFLFACVLAGVSTISFAEDAASSQNNYFKALAEIKALPAGMVAVEKCSPDEKKQVINRLKTKNFANASAKNRLFLLDISDIYKGDFSNEGLTEYAVLTSAGSMGANTVTVYKQINNELVDMYLDTAIINNLFPGQDMSRFYLQVATPFAVVNHGKTLMRFMQYPAGQDYDATKLKLCTYVWEGPKFSLASPNWTFDSKGHKVAAKDCLGNFTNA